MFKVVFRLEEEGEQEVDCRLSVKGQMSEKILRALPGAFAAVDSSVLKEIRREDSDSKKTISRIADIHAEFFRKELRRSLELSVEEEEVSDDREDRG